MNVLFIGPAKLRDQYRREHPDDNVVWARSGPQAVKGLDGPIKIVHELHPKVRLDGKEWEAIHVVRDINDHHKNGF